MIYGKSNNAKIEIEESLKKKMKFICSFCNTTIIIENRGLETIYRVNVTYEKLIELYKRNSIFNFNYEIGIYIEKSNNKILIKNSKFCSYDIIILKRDSIL